MRRITKQRCAERSLWSKLSRHLVNPIRVLQANVIVRCREEQFKKVRVLRRTNSNSEHMRMLAALDGIVWRLRTWPKPIALCPKSFKCPYERSSNQQHRSRWAEHPKKQFRRLRCCKRSRTGPPLAKWEEWHDHDLHI